MNVLPSKNSISK